MNRKISVGMTVTIVILAMTVTFSITMLMAMRLFDHTVTSVKEKESMYNKVAEVDRYVPVICWVPATSTPATTPPRPIPTCSTPRAAS